MVKFFINQYKAINLLVILIIGFGIFTFIQGRKEGFPNIGLDLIIVSTAYPGASADDVEALVTEKIENEIDTIDGASKINSFSSENLSIIRFEVDTDVGRTTEEIVEDIRTAIDTISFADGVEDATIEKLDFASTTVNINAGFVGQTDIENLKNLANQFKSDIKKVEGVGNVELVNYPEQEVWVEIFPGKLKEYELELSTIISAIKAENINIPAGKLNLEGKEFFIKTSKEYESLESIKKTILRSNDRGLSVRLEEIAQVRWAHEELLSYVRTEEAQGVWVKIFKAPNGDAIKVSKAVKDLLAQYKEEGRLPPGVRTLTTDDLAFYVERRLSVLSTNATFGLFLVFLCMVIFFNLRVTFWTILGIPFSFCLAIIIAYAIGMTLNLMTMFGLIIVVGMIVDDAIIIAENIYGYVEKGMPFYEAAVRGTEEMLIPVVAIIATTTLAFLPLTTLPGIFGDVLGIIPQIVVITLLCSLIECIFVLPGHLANLKNKETKPAPQGTATQERQGIGFLTFFRFLTKRFRRSPDTSANAPIHSIAASPALPQKPRQQRRWFQKVNKVYERFLEKIVKRPILTSFLFVTTLVGLAGYMATQVPFVFFPGEAESILVDIETPTYNSLDQTAEVLDEVETRIREATSGGSYVIDLVSTVGQDSTFQDVPNFQSYIGFVRVYLDTSRSETDEFILDVVEKAIQDVSGTTEKKVTALKGGPPAGSPIDIYISGNQITHILEATEEVITFVESLPNVTSVTSSYQPGKEEIHVIPDSEMASMLGVDINNLAYSVRNAFASNSSTTITSLSSFSTNDDEIDLIVKYMEDEERALDDIYNTHVRNQRGYNIPLKNISELSFNESSGRLTREDGKLYISVTGLLKNEKSKEHNAAAILSTITEQFPSWREKFPNLNFEIKGQSEEEADIAISLVKALLLSIFCIYFVLTIIFKSYVQPFIIMSIIPLGFLGVLIGLYLTNTAIGLMPFLGGIALMGIVVNDSLVMVDKVNRLRRDEGLDKYTAVIQGAKNRMRPILMTSLTTIVGIAPLAYGILGEEPFLAPMGIALMWGLILGTPLLLVLLPVFYLIVDNIMEFVYKLFKKEYRFAPAPQTIRDNSGQQTN